MSEFLTPVDVANRGLQHCGAPRIDPTLGFAERSKAASECGFVYGKLRRAELQRNTWKFAIKEAFLRPISATTMALVPVLWVSTTTYFVGSIVSDATGTAWISLIRDNLGMQPQTTSAWAEYFGPMTVSLFDPTATTAYEAGELVYTAPGDGTNRVYMSLIAGNSDNPATATAWDATVTYFKNQVVTRSAIAYMSLIDLNINQDPALAPALWNAGTTYGAATKVGGSDGVIYQSIAGGNIGHDPTASPAFWTNTGVLNPWTKVFTSGIGSLNWRQIGGAEFPMGVTVAPLIDLSVTPIGTGPLQQMISRNIYRLPASFLRLAPQDPKAGQYSFLGAPGNWRAEDWTFEGVYFTTACSTPIRLRFVADIVDVTSFDDMFCEGLGARIGFEVCEAVTQSTQKKQTIAAEYGRFMGEARLSNAILISAVQPPLDDWLAARA